MADTAPNERSTPLMCCHVNLEEATVALKDSAGCTYFIGPRWVVERLESSLLARAHR